MGEQLPIGDNEQSDSKGFITVHRPCSANDDNDEYLGINSVVFLQIINESTSDLKYPFGCLWAE